MRIVENQQAQSQVVAAREDDRRVELSASVRDAGDGARLTLDPDCRAWEFDNLYVTDGSCMPTSGSANPTNTIEANAFRVAEVLLGRL